MEAIYLFIFLFIGLTIGFGIILGDSSRTEVIQHWAERRCDFDVILSSFMYKPSEDKRSSAEFAGDNLKFCVGSKASDYLHTIFGAMFEIIRKQMGAADVFTEVMKVLRIQLNSIHAPFSKMMNKFWVKFKQIGSLSSRIFQHLYMAMKKAAATAVASLYVAMSLQTSILNSIDLTINVIMIILYILIIFAIIFFLPILPVLIIVILTVGGIEAAMPGRTGGMGEVFCFHKNTPIVTRTRTITPINEIQVGDILLHGQMVEAVIELPPPIEPLYIINGIYVSGDHRIWSKEAKKWLLVKEHPNAVQSSVFGDSLWTLITTNRQIPTGTASDYTLFSDWEELPDTDASAELWEKLVREILLVKTNPTAAPKYAPCFDENIKVNKYQSGWVSIHEIKRDDWIQADNTWTRVLGVCKRAVNGGYGSKGSRITDGIWLRSVSGDWIHPTLNCDTSKWHGVNLITDIGMFKIRLSNCDSDLIVRDFTEVGYSNLDKTYTRVEAQMVEP